MIYENRTSFVKAAFAYIGVEIVAVCAGEAKYPRKDVPFVAKSVFLVTIAIYTFSVMFMTLVVPWTEPSLLKITDNTNKFTGSRSPFIIAIKIAGYKVLPGLVNAAFLFMAWTAANTSLYVASRTLHGMCYGLEKSRSQFFWPLGRTRRRNGAPVMAILASCIPAPLAWLVCSTQEPKEVSSTPLSSLKQVRVTDSIE
jgi:yeast amino acid transporter